MKILCSISGLEFNCDYFPGTFYSKETYHPIFHLEQKRLLPYLRKWSSGELTTTDSYLLFIAILRSSELVHFRVPVNRNEHTDTIIYNNMEYLARTVIKLNTVHTPAALFPSYAITPDTKFLTNVHYWIQNWDREYAEFQSGKRKEYDDRKLIKREAALERLIKNPHKPISAYAKDIADWAAVAGDFPKFNTKSPFTGMVLSITDLWKDIIIRCAKNELLYSIPANDLSELIEHCEDRIPIGSIYSHALFKVLRDAKKKQNNFIDLGDSDIGTGATYQLLSADTSVEAANMKALIDSAPLEEPRQEQYPTKFKYIQAKLRWDMAQKYGKE